MVYLARAMNGGTDPTDTSAHDGYFTDTIDTTARLVSPISATCRSMPT